MVVKNGNKFQKILLELKKEEINRVKSYYFEK
jgi:hypothetical protein